MFNFDQCVLFGFLDPTLRRSLSNLGGEEAVDREATRKSQSDLLFSSCIQQDRILF